MQKSLEKEYQYYLDNEDKFIEDYKGKFIVIKNQKIIGSYDNELEAIENTTKKHKIGTFLVQKCDRTTTEVQMFHSRVIFTE